MTTVIIIGAIILCLLALLAEDFGKPYQQNKNRRKHQAMTKYKNKSSYNNSVTDIYCPECGSPNVTVYRDGSCRCQDCEFPFHIDYL